MGAQSTYYSFDTTIAYPHSTPWFMLLDSAGNVIRDTVYSSGYMDGGYLFKDSIGGYIHIGQIDTFETNNPDDEENFPFYIAHLDTNFRIQWITRFPFNHYFGRRYGWKAIQLRDGNFLIEGDAEDTGTYTYVTAWAAKIDRSGNILWQQYYVSDSSQNAYFRDVTELPNGNLVFIGASFNDTLPAWHQLQDAWLVGTDSNGCILPGGCNPNTTDGVKPVTLSKEQAFKVYPNPTYGSLTITASGSGTFTLYTLLGQQLQDYQIITGQTEVQLPTNLAAGVYIGEFKPADGSAIQQVSLVYQP